MSNQTSPKIKYKWPPNSSKIELVGFECDTEEREHALIVDDPSVTNQAWLIKGVSVRYVFTQVLRTYFTNPESYTDTHRTPPMSVSGATAMAAQISKINLPDMLGSAVQDSVSNKAKTSNWELLSHDMQLQEPGTYVVTYKLGAATDYIWDSSAFKKFKYPAPASLAASYSASGIRS
jgi:hypothetical protein